MLFLDVFLCILLLVSAGYLLYSSYTMYNNTTDESHKTTIKQISMIQGGQLLCILLLLQSVWTINSAPAVY